ncbi:FMI2 protein [Arthroderma uncinatum]|uniref:FMI2 protein n=1 Tax=Arthroderma uncinatum TaxID=74035 RepID=UPI00144A6F5F|nr:FMI2 protein [Arthroderma uncinatum]KAF3482556.1 FMI2 protein [Arthroderma uncinatum]
MEPSTPQYIANQQYTSGWWAVEQGDGVHSAIEIAETEPLTVPASHDFPLGQFACLELINSLPSAQLPGPMHCSDWSYEQRRAAQSILPFLYLGPATVTRDQDFLRREGITLLLAIRDRNRVQALTVNGDKAAAALGIESDFFEVSSTQELISQFPNAIRRINNHICPCPSHRPPGGSQEERKVLVFCDTGNEKSACVVAAYLMVMYHARAVAAGSHVQVRRLCTNLGLAFGNILMSFETILDAQKAVVRNTAAQQKQAGGLEPDCQPSRKRSFYVAYESSTDGGNMGMDMDLGGQEREDYPSRPSLPPFRDLSRG